MVVKRKTIKNWYKHVEEVRRENPYLSEREVLRKSQTLWKKGKWGLSQCEKCPSLSCKYKDSRPKPFKRKKLIVKKITKTVKKPKKRKVLKRIERKRGIMSESKQNYLKWLKSEKII